MGNFLGVMGAKLLLGLFLVLNILAKLNFIIIWDSITSEVYTWNFGM
jgi:hypothetical protein